ncbi:MAG TPA: aminotransferase class I/II-fold pyridoxal phosphate-dependent enzyme [Candidatus Limnocylindria bacterium]|jgi:aspartate aminotransferase|nr:aminotransferase class I/II-fold pyridoxal phosphate-dependent enzyme [Candidatus Limnocylindria bacterium]
MRPISRKMGELLDAHRRLLEFFVWFGPRLAQEGIADFVAGNPQEMPLPEYVAAIKRWTEPKRTDWFAYQMNVPEAQRAVVASLAERRGVRYAEEDVALTTGAFAGLEIAMRVVCDEGDEVIYLTPPWFFYDGIARGLGLVPVKVPVDMRTFDIDVGAVGRAITARTRAVIVNSPNNPTGRLYPRETLDRLATILEAASRRNGRQIYLLSDEAYHRILYEGHRYVSPTESYPRSILIYTYGKQLLTPGERIGFLALPPTMPAEEREPLRNAITMAQLVGGWSWPNAVVQYALADIDRLTIDIAALQRKRDRMVRGLRGAGYELHMPDGTFYLLPKSPWRDDWAFTQHLAESDVYVLPGEVVEMPGYFRISLTASDAMIDKALPVFAAAAKERVPA